MVTYVALRWALQISRGMFMLVLTLKSQAIINMQSVIFSCHTLIVGASDCGHVGEYFVFWCYFLFSGSLISKRRYIFWKNVLWMLYWWKHFELIKHFDSFDCYFLSYHVVFKKLKVVTAVQQLPLSTYVNFNTEKSMEVWKWYRHYLTRFSHCWFTTLPTKIFGQKFVHVC